MNNYPDDIRSYDYDPRSPFCEEATHFECESCGLLFHVDDYPDGGTICDDCLNTLD